MSPIEAQPDTRRASVRLRGAISASSVGGAWKCLLVSSNDALLESMRQAAVSSGWDCVVCQSPKDSLKLAFLNRFGLALVDIDPIESRPVLQNLFRIVADSSSGLVVAHDGRGDAQSELWARENGAWMYVPGIDDWSDLAVVCTEARRLAAKLRENGTSGALC